MCGLVIAGVGSQACQHRKQLLRSLHARPSAHTHTRANAYAHRRRRRGLVGGLLLACGELLRFDETEQRLNKYLSTLRLGYRVSDA